MTFNSLQYATFLPIVWLVYRSLHSHRHQNAWLLAMSYVFYGAWDWRFLSLIWISTLVDFNLARRIAEHSNTGKRRGLLIASFSVNLGILTAFKYFGFFIESATTLLKFVGLQPNPPLLEVLLPVGISFYTFQTISYTFDVYRRRIQPTDDLITFGLYVAYFPQLVAGPIERARHLLPQLQQVRPRPDREATAAGLLLIARGLFRKIVIADTAALLANVAFNSPSEAHWAVLAGGVLAFGVQIYGDFAGYSDIARGTSRLFGIELVVNFRRPYAALTITEFWRRWHISLSNWLRDYLYIPLGGNRRGNLATYRNLMLTMLLGGLWHGAAWTFVVWGGIHGLALAIERRFALDQNPLKRGARAFRWLVTFAIVHASWVFFRASDFAEALAIFRGIASLQSGGIRVEMLVLPFVLLTSALVDMSERAWNERGLSSRALQRPLVVGSLIGFVAAAVIVFSGRPQVPFIYFQF